MRTLINGDDRVIGRGSNRIANQPGFGRLVLACSLVFYCATAGGCGLGQWLTNGFKVGPNYATPTAPVAEHWIDYQRPEVQANTQDAQLNSWWRVFDDPVLNSLISDAYQQNLSLRTAGERVAEARAVRGVAVGNLFPQQQDLSGSAYAVKASDRTDPKPPQQWFSDGQLAFNLSWELDFWGRFRRSIEAADAALEASIASYDDVLVVLLSDLATTYVQYRTFQERLELAKRNVHIQEDAYQLASDSFRLGKTTERDPAQAKQILEQTRSQIPELETGLRRANNAICVLLGIPPQDLAPRLGDSGIIPTGRPEWSDGLPADLLRRRPDVRRAEREAAAQSAAIGIAKSDLYPRFSLNGSIGVHAEEFGGLWHTPGSWSGFGGPAFQWNILNYGQIDNAVKAQEARFRQSVYRYQSQVLQANREVEDAMISFHKSQERVKFLAESVAAAQRTVDITYEQYRQGVTDFTAVFIFEAALTSQQDALAQARGDIALSLVDVYRSLGGGWERPQSEKDNGELEQSDVYAAPAVAAPTTQRASASRPTTIP